MANADATSAGVGTSSTLSANVSVDFGAEQGELPHPERYNNFGNVTVFPAQRAQDVSFLNQQGLHGSVYRTWLSSPGAPAADNVFNECDLATQKCDFTPLDAYLTQAGTVSDSVLVNLNPTDFVTGKRPIADLEPLLELILRNLKEKYPRVDYVEVFNEPDWQFYGQALNAGQPSQATLQPGGLYPFYVPFYQAVNKINKGLRSERRIQVGGPAFSFLDPKWFQPFLSAFAADPNPHKRLDFISYHSYLKWDDSYKVPTFYKDDLRMVAADRTTLQGWLKNDGLPKETPAFITETGIYPGPSFDDPAPKNDYLRQAAAMATDSYMFGNQPNTYMFNWCVRHGSQERKDELVTRTANGPLTNTLTPYGNVMLMQSMMKDTKVSAVADGLQADHGVYALASKDHTGASLMVWNWQHTDDSSYQATIDMSRLPSNLRHGPVRERVYRIDQTTSDYFTDPSTANLQMVDQKTVQLGRTHTESLALTPNAIYLILFEPAA